MGQLIWVPDVTLTEIEDIMDEDGYEKKGDAIKMLTKYCRVGRELKRIRTLKFGNIRNLPEIEVPEPTKTYKINPKANGKDYFIEKGVNYE